MGFAENCMLKIGESFSLLLRLAIYFLRNRGMGGNNDISSSGLTTMHIFNALVRRQRNIYFEGKPVSLPRLMVQRKTSDLHSL
jgi:hypothetical protein